MLKTKLSTLTSHTLSTTLPIAHKRSKHNRRRHQLSTITSSAHDFQSLMQFSSHKVSPNTDTAALYERNQDQKLPRIYQHSTFHRAVRVTLAIIF